MSTTPTSASWLRERFIPLLLLLLYAVCTGLYSLGQETELASRRIEEDMVQQVSVQLAQLQGVLGYLLQEGHTAPVRELLASLGSDAYLQVGLLMDGQQTVLASTRPPLLGLSAQEAWPELKQPEHQERMHRALEQPGALVELSADRHHVIGYCPVLMGKDGSLERPGLLLLEYELTAQEQASRAEVRQSVLRSTGLMLVLAAGIGLIVQFLMGRRIRRLAVATQELEEQVGRGRERIEENEERFQTLIERSPEATIIHWEGRVVFNNPAAATLLGYEQAVELQGRRIEELVLPEDCPVLTEPSEQSGPREVHWLHRSGRQVLGEVVSFPVLFERQRVRVSIVRDISERKQLEQKLHSADRMASLGSLAAGVAHELNNPLAFMLSNARFVREELRQLHEEPAARSPERQREVEEALDEMLAGGDRVSDIIRDLKTFARGDDGARGPVNIHAVLDLCANIARNQLRHRARLVKDYGEVPPVHASESRLAQLFLNLIVNAAQAIPEGAGPTANEVRVTTRRQEDQLVVSITDTGAGIAPEHLHRLFEPFFTTKPAAVGTGLGLSICHGIVSGLGGHITVESEPGRGSTFRVFLPLGKT